MAKKKNKKKSKQYNSQDLKDLVWWIWTLSYFACIALWYGIFTDASMRIASVIIFVIVLTLINGLHIFLKRFGKKSHALHQESDGRVVDENGNEIDGIAYEHYVAEKLKLRGFYNVDVTQASGDYGADIICYDKQGNKIAVQCKKYAGSVGIDAVQQVIGAKDFYKCSRAMVITTATFTPAAKNLAEKANVELYERYF